MLKPGAAHLDLKPYADVVTGDVVGVALKTDDVPVDSDLADELVLAAKVSEAVELEGGRDPLAHRQINIARFLGCGRCRAGTTKTRGLGFPLHHQGNDVHE